MCTEDQNGKNETDGVRKLDLATAYIHGACLTFLDSFGSGITSIDRYVCYALCYFVKDCIKIL
jgi:hypothetical protein